jgi:hypothetical protein
LSTVGRHFQTTTHSCSARSSRIYRTPDQPAHTSGSTGTAGPGAQPLPWALPRLLSKADNGPFVCSKGGADGGWMSPRKANSPPAPGNLYVASGEEAHSGSQRKIAADAAGSWELWNRAETSAAVLTTCALER